GSVTPIVTGLPTYSVVDVAIDANGDFIVGNNHCWNNPEAACSIDRISPDGAVQPVFTYRNEAGGLAKRLTNSIAIDAQGRYVVAVTDFTDTANLKSEVWRITVPASAAPFGEVIADSQNFTNAQGVVIEADDDYLVTDANAIRHIDVPDFGLSTFAEEDPLSSPMTQRFMDIVRDASDNLYFTDEVNKTLRVLSVSGDVKTFGTIASGSPLSSPQDVALLKNAAPPLFNRAPIIFSEPVTTATVGFPYAYQVEARDADGDPFILSLLNPQPPDMGIGMSGLITWTPQQSGEFQVSVTAGDGLSISRQDFLVNVAEPGSLPDVVNMTLDEAMAILSQFGFTNIDDTESVYDAAPPGEVVSQSPSEGTLWPLDGLVKLVVSLGPVPPAIVPPVVTMQLLQAIHTVADAGLLISTITGSPVFKPAGEVLSQSPVGGTKALQGDPVALDFAQGSPTITSQPPLEAVVGQLYTYQVTATDPDQDVLEFRLDISPTGMDIDIETGLIQWTPTSDQTGDNPVTVRVTDAGELFDEQSFVIAVNAPPQIVSTPILSAVEGQPYTYDVDANDPNAGDSLTFSLDFAPFDFGMTIDPITGLITWTPTNLQFMADDFITFETIPGLGVPAEGMSISDQYLDTLGVSFAHEDGSFPVIAQVGEPLTAFQGFDGGADQPELSQGAGDFFLTDDGLLDGPPLSPLLITFEKPVMFVEGFILDVDGTERWTVQARNANGEALETILVSSSDPTAGDGLASVWGFNRATPDIYSIRIEYSGTQQTDVGFAFDNLFFFPPSGHAAFAEVTARVADSGGLFDTQTFFIQVENTNGDPEIVSTPELTAIAGVPYIYNAFADDPDIFFGDTLAFSLFDAPQGPPDMTIVLNHPLGAAIIEWTPDASQIGFHSVGLRVTDEAGETHDQQFQIQVVNTLLVALDSNVDTNEDTQIPIILTAVNGAECDVTFTIVDFPTNGELSGITDIPCIITEGGNSDSASVTYTPAPDFFGEDSFTFFATDSFGDSNLATVSITVNPLNDAPVGFPDIYHLPDGESITIRASSLLFNDVDVDGDTLSVSIASQPSEGFVTDNGDGSFTYMPCLPNGDCNPFDGLDSFEYEVSDDSDELSDIGVVWIVGGACGDFDDDDDFDGDDVRAILTFAAQKLINPIPDELSYFLQQDAPGMIRGDLDRNRIVNVRDAIIALRHLDNSTPLPGCGPEYSAPIVGYYDLNNNSGVAAQVAPINLARFEPVNVGDLNTANLNQFDILFVQNPSNGGYTSDYLTNIQKIFDFVSGGGVLIFHDRHVTTAANVLPGSPGTFFRNESSDTANIDILDDTTAVTNGPGGVLTDASLDFGNFSSHGYIDAATIPAGAKGILSRTDPAHLVTYSYPFGSGHVIYSTIPLDHYLNGSGSPTVNENMHRYAANVIAYAQDLR
ncbi:MAG: Ig-like domain-containing protein, partial [Chloroflexi bacterium]|nr:Ig-like domain-containing protein [Chloroflexota bacterium]